jgi:hypothetical protein
LIPGPGASCYILLGVGECLRICVAHLASPGSSIRRLLPGPTEPQLRLWSSIACRCTFPSRHGRTRLPVLPRWMG